MSDSRKGESFLSRLRRLKPSFICGRHKYYDHLLNKLEIYADKNHGHSKYLANTSRVKIHKVWDIFKQTFIDECFNRGTDRKWTAVPYLNIVDSPCAPGSVILCYQRDFKDKLRMRPKPAFFAGGIGDFWPPERINVRHKVMTHKTAKVHWREYFRVYQSERSEKAVLISLVVEEKQVMERQFINRANNTFIDLDNFEDTGFHPGYCYVVTKVITARSLKLEMTDDGEIFYDYEYKGSIPVCFQACKVYVEAESLGEIDRIIAVKKVIGLSFRKRRSWQTFIDAFTPNQVRLGESTGDYPSEIFCQEALPRQSYRPYILPRHDRAKNDFIWYFHSEAELQSLKYNFKRDRRRNRHLNTLLAPLRLQNAHNDDAEKRTYYPKPIRRPIEYEDFEAYL
ncbi:hypothetical protein ACF0H5_010105 [Mactra antiquata]